MIKKINTIQNEQELVILRKPCEQVLGVSNDVVEVVNDLAETAANDPNCIGLAANQIWDNPHLACPRVFVLKMGENQYGPIINPTVTKVFNKTITRVEGCMSVPGLAVEVERPYHIVVSYIDAEGTFISDQHLFDMVAREFLHEIDHLDGKLITDYGKPFRIRR